VFPRLRELCLHCGCRFQAIDLRWGVGGEAALNQQTMKICLEELKRCQWVTAAQPPSSWTTGTGIDIEGEKREKF